MMRAFFLGSAFALSLAAPPAFAQTAPAPAPAPVATAAAAAKSYSTTATDIGTLMDNPDTKAIVDKYIPGFSADPRVDQARPMTLRDVQPYAPDTLTDKALASIDADLAKLPVKK